MILNGSPDSPAPEPGACAFHFLSILSPFPVHSTFRCSDIVEDSQLAHSLQPVLYMDARLIFLKYSSVQVAQVLPERSVGLGRNRSDKVGWAWERGREIGMHAGVPEAS